MITEHVRDLRKEALDKDMTCPHCFTVHTKRRERPHLKTLACIARRNEKVCKDLGLVYISDGTFGYRVCEASKSGVMVRAETDFCKATKYAKAKIALQSWVPKWVHAIFTEDYATLIYRSSWEEATPLYAALVARMVEDAETKEAVLAAHALSGNEGVRNFVITPKMRAASMREEAHKLSERASKLYEEARGLDPASAAWEVGRTR